MDKHEAEYSSRRYIVISEPIGTGSPIEYRFPNKIRAISYASNFWKLNRLLYRTVTVYDRLPELSGGLPKPIWRSG